MSLGTQETSMANGERQLDRDPDVEVDLDLDSESDADLDVGPGPAAESSTESEDAGVRERVRSRAGEFFSGRSMALALVVTLGGAFLAGGALPLGLIGNLLGIFVAAFLYGTAASTSRYLEHGLAGGIVAGGLALFGNLALSLLGPGVPIVALGFGVGAVAGGLGHYFGRDLRDGLTRDL